MRMENGEEGWKRRVNEDGREDINGRGGVKQGLHGWTRMKGRL